MHFFFALVIITLLQCCYKQHKERLANVTLFFRPTTEKTNSTPENTFYTICEVKQHNHNMDSAWIVVGSDIYDITTYLHEHPGGSKVIIATSGVESRIVPKILNFILDKVVKYGNNTKLVVSRNAMHPKKP